MTFLEAAAWCKRFYPVNSRRYTVRLRRDLWEALAFEIFMQERAIRPFPPDKPFCVLIRNVQILPWDGTVV